MAHTFTRLLYHLIWSTKHRKPAIDASLKPQLHAYLTGIAANLNGKALIVNGTADHVHLLLSLPATVAVAEAVQDEFLAFLRKHGIEYDKRYIWE